MHGIYVQILVKRISEAIVSKLQFASKLNILYFRLTKESQYVQYRTASENN